MKLLERHQVILVREGLEAKAKLHRQHAATLHQAYGAGGNEMISAPQCLLLAKEHEAMAMDCDRLIDDMKSFDLGFTE